MSPFPRDETRCLTMVGAPPHYLHFHQCKRKRGHGPDGKFCKQHGKLEDKRAALWETLTPSETDNQQPTKEDAK
jgi:hypothetical protein